MDEAYKNCFSFARDSCNDGVQGGLVAFVMGRKALEPKARRYAMEGRELARAREKTRKNPTDMAKLIGVKVQTYQHWEYGNNRPGVDKFAAIRQHLKIDPGDLYSPMGKAMPTPHSEFDPKAINALVDALEANIGQTSRNLRALKLLVEPYVKANEAESQKAGDTKGEA